MSIQAVLIIKNGTCIFSRQYGDDEKLDAQLVAGFLTAVSQFTEQAAGEKLQNIKMDNSSFYSCVDENVQFIYKHDDTKKNELQKIAQTLQKQFLDTFRLPLQNFAGDIGVFEKFAKDADGIIAMKGRRIQQKMHDFFVSF